MDEGTLRPRVDAWVREGLVTPGQAQAILERERQPVPPATEERRLGSARTALLFLLAAALPFVVGTLLALALADFLDEGIGDARQLNDSVATLMVATGIVGAAWGAWARRGLPGQLAIVGGASLLVAVPFWHPEAPFWALLPAPLLLAMGLAMAQPPQARVANAVLLPVAMVPVFDAFPSDSESLLLSTLVVAFWLVTCLLLAPLSGARTVVALGLTALAAAAMVLTLYFLVTDPTWQRVVVLFGTAGLAALFFAFARHPRLRGLTVRPLAG